MAEIIPYKIATRTWAHNTMGSAAKLSYSTGNDCLIVSDINQDSSTYLITPSSTTNGAIPSSYLSNSNKCIKQSELDDKYDKHYVNVDAKIAYNSNAALVAGKYNLIIRVYYKNIDISSSGATYPIHVGILKNIDVTVTIRCFNKIAIDPIAETTASCSLIANINSINEIGVTCLDIKNAPVVIGDPATGLISNELFVAKYLSDMYNYYNGGTSTYTYDIISQITPEYGAEYGSICQPQKYIPLPTNVITTSSTSYITANVKYECTSNSMASLVPGVEIIWGYKIIVSNISPSTTTTPESSITVTVDKGIITRNNSWNNISKTLTITGTVKYTPTTEAEFHPYVYFNYKKNGYTPLSRTFVVNMTQSVLG